MENEKLKYTLLLGGGAIRGVAYCGVIKALEELHVEYSTLAGSSVGSVIAGFLAVGYNPQEIKEIMLGVNFELFRDIQLSIGQNFAFSKGEVFLEWLRDLIEKKYYGDEYKKGTHKAVTFSDLDKNLVIITTDLSNFECKEFSKFETPDFEVAKAIRISSSMPGLMKPIEYNNRTLVDGDLQKSAPMWSLSKNLQPENERILEFRLEGDFQGTDKNAVDFINAIYSYATRTGTKFLKDLYGCRDKDEYVLIDKCDINIVDFNLSDKRREELVQDGYQQTMRYFKTDLKEKKKNLLNVYTGLLSYLEKCRYAILKQKPIRARDNLGAIYVNLCENIDLINPTDKKYLKNFKDVFMLNFKYPGLFGKIRLENQNLVINTLDICIENIKIRINDYKSYINKIST